MSRLIQVFEHERLTLGSKGSERSISRRELDQLYTFNDRNENRYFTGIRDGVKFSSYVGVIQIGNLTIEILPKPDRKASGSEADYQRWHGVLLDMLQVCNKVAIHSISESNLRRRQHSILDMYLAMFLDEVEALLRRGLAKKYRRDQGSTLSLKGQILFAQHIRDNLIHQEQFYTRHQVYDRDHLANQIIRESLLVIKDLAGQGELSNRASELLEIFPRVSRKTIRSAHFERIGQSRGLRGYEKALSISKMILLNYSPSIRTGSEQMLALLFDMNLLWEEYIYRMLKRGKHPNWTVLPQQRKKFWNAKVIKPDLVIQKIDGDRTFTFVIDTKWKVLDSGYPKPSDDDLKQMFVYNEYWSSSQSMLLYPTTEPRSEVLGHFWSQDAIDKVHSCKLSFVSVLNEKGRLNLDIGQSIIDKLEASVKS